MAEWLARVDELPTVLLIVALGAVMVLDAIPLLGVLVPGDVAILATMGAGGPARDAGALVGVVGGSLAGWSVVFFAGRLFGDRIRCGRLGRWIGEPRWAAVERVLGQGGGRMVVAAPFLPVLNALIPLAAGGLRMSYPRFLSHAALGAALWGGLYVGLGMTAGVVGEVLPGDSFTTIATIAIGLAFGWLAVLGARRRLRFDLPAATDVAVRQTPTSRPGRYKGRGFPAGYRRPAGRDRSRRRRSRTVAVPATGARPAISSTRTA